MTTPNQRQPHSSDTRPRHIPPAVPVALAVLSVCLLALIAISLRYEYSTRSVAGTRIEQRIDRWTGQIQVWVPTDGGQWIRMGDRPPAP